MGSRSIWLVGIPQRKGKKLIHYEDDELNNAADMRKFLNEYNNFIQQTSILLDYVGYRHQRKIRPQSRDKISQLPKSIHIDLTKKKMKRVFNNNSFAQGGRFYNGFWMEMPSALRLRLIIDMQKVIEADYSGIHIHLLYNQIGIDYGAKMEDPYAVPGYKETKEHRNLFKKLLLAAINAEGDGKSTGETKAIRALLKHIKYNRADYPDEIPKLRTVLEDFKEYHKPISGFLCTAKGMFLMCQDSQIAELVMKSMLARGVTVLPVHDSFVCPKQYSDTLLDVMTWAYQQVTGKQLTATKFTVNIKEPDEWDRSDGNELLPDDDYYFDPNYSEDESLIVKMYRIEMDELEQLSKGDIVSHLDVSPNKTYINIPIEYITS